MSSTAAKPDPTPSPTPASEDVEAVLLQELEERRQDEEDLAAYEIARAEEGSVSLDELRRELGI